MLYYIYIMYIIVAMLNVIIKHRKKRLLWSSVPTRCEPLWGKASDSWSCSATERMNLGQWWFQPIVTINVQLFHSYVK